MTENAAGSLFADALEKQRGFTFESAPLIQKAPHRHQTFPDLQLLKKNMLVCDSCHPPHDFTAAWAPSPCD